MSVIYKTDTVTVLSHKKYIDKCYNNVLNIENSEQQCYEMNPEIFNMIPKPANDINQPAKKKRKKAIEQGSTDKHQQSEIDAIETKFKYFYSQNNDIFQTISSTSNTLDFKDSNNLATQQLSGANPSNPAILSKVADDFYLFPPNCQWYNCSADAGLKKISTKSFDLIVMDPPWWNKYVRRVRHVNPQLGYQMMWNDDLKALGIDKISHSKSVIAIWCTNATSHIKCVKEELLPHWGFKLMATCYWVKVTTDGSPIKEFDAPNKKQPFERLFIAAKNDFSEVDKLKSLDGNLIVSVPSIIHSHKPPLLDLLKDLFLNKEPCCLEIFARYLLPGFTSVGNEVIKLQQLNLYQEIRS